MPQSLLRRETPRSTMFSTVDPMNVASPPQNASSDLKKTPKRLRSADHVFTLGIEEELQIIDPETRELRSYIQQILADGKIILKEQIKPELHQSIVEIGTGICSDARDARRQITALRTELAKACGAAWVGNRFSRHASVFSLDGSIDHGQTSATPRS